MGPDNRDYLSEWEHLNEIDMAWLKSMRGSKGDTGDRGPVGSTGKPPRDSKVVQLDYAGLKFPARIEQSTIDLIDTDQPLNGDDLALIRAVNIIDWRTIRGAWSDEWIRQQAYRAFELGDIENEKWDI